MLFGICFSILLFNVIFNNHPITDTGFEYKPRQVIKSTTLWFVVISLGCFLIHINKEWLKKNKFLALYILVLINICIQTFFAVELEIESGGDVKAVYKGGIEWAVSQRLGYYEEYFHVFPNNLGAAFFLKNIYSIALFFSINNYFLVGVALNLLLINISIILVFLISEKLWGIQAAFTALMLCLSCIPIYFFTPIFYTDTFSLPFLVLSLYLYILARDAKNDSTLLLLFILMGLACGIGTEIKFSVIICFFAMLLDTIWYGRFRKFALHFSIATLIIISIKAGFTKYIYSNVLDKSIAYQKNVPYTHWISMGIEGYGSFNPRALELTLSTPPEDRINVHIEIIKNKLNEFGLKGYLKFLIVKGVHSFGSGVYGVYQILDDDPKNESFLHRIGLINGKYFKEFNYVCQGWHVLVFLFIILSSFLDVKNRGLRVNQDQFLRFSIFGIYLFLLIWESNPRYIFNFIPVFILCATHSITTIFQSFFKKNPISLGDL